MSHYSIHYLSQRHLIREYDNEKAYEEEVGIKVSKNDLTM